MGIISEAVKHMLKAGMDADAITAAVSDMEAAQEPVRSKAAIRQERYRRNKASQNVTSDAKEIPPTPPKENTPPSPPKGGSSPQRQRFQDPAAILQAETDPLTARRYADHMRQRGPRLTEQSTQAVVNVLREVRELGGKPSEALELAMSKGWGIFEIEWLRNAGMKLGGGSKETTDAVWQQRLDYWKQGQGWPHAWGPEPGTDGCKLPDHFNTQPEENAA